MIQLLRTIHTGFEKACFQIIHSYIHTNGRSNSGLGATFLQILLRWFSYLGQFILSLRRSAGMTGMSIPPGCWVMMWNTFLSSLKHMWQHLFVTFDDLAKKIFSKLPRLKKGTLENIPKSLLSTLVTQEKHQITLEPFFLTTKYYFQ